MVAAVSSTSTQSATLASAADSTTTLAQLKAQLAAKQSELAQAKTDDEKSKINAEITDLKSEIATAQGSDKQGQQASAAASKADQARKGQYNTADKAAPESKLSSASMDVLMRLGQRGGMMPFGGAGGPPNIAQMYTDMDADSDGKVTKDEFVTANEDHMSEEGANKLFASIDTENTGSITEEQFAKSMHHDRHGGGAPFGPRPGDHSMPAEQFATSSDSNLITIG